MTSIRWMLLVALAVVISACAPAAPSSAPSGSSGFSGTTIKIVSSYPLTGGDSADGVSMANSAKQALQDHGAKSGNFTLVYQSFDDASAAKGAWDGDIETSNANKAVAD